MYKNSHKKGNKKMAEYLSPGVYVEEYDNSPRAIEGVGTSTAGFIGMAVKGPTKGAPALVTSYANFIRQYGGFLSEFSHGEYRYLASSVEQFFANGGTKCFVARVIPEDAVCAKCKAGILKIRAANEGSWGNRIQVLFTTILRKKMQLIKSLGEKEYLAKTTNGFMEGDLVVVGDEYNKIATIFDNTITFENEFENDVVDDNLVPKTVIYLVEVDIQVKYQEETEIYNGISFNIASPNYIISKLHKSELITIEIDQTPFIENPVSFLLEKNCEAGFITLLDGSDGDIGKVTASTFIGEDYGAGRRTGIQAFLENNIISMIAVPGVTLADVIVSLVSHCENLGSRFAVLDMKKDMSDTKEMTEYREMIDSSYAAMYHPWIQNFDRSTQKAAFFPPSGAVMGVFARTDANRGVHKAPANETVMCSGLNINFTMQEQDILNPLGINLIRALPGQGIRIWGARTTSSNSNFKYVNVRRLFIFLEESIKVNTNWVVFEPNDSTLWNRVNITISGFLNTMWRSGMMAGDSPESSYFVEIGPTTMTRDDILNGKLICNIGIAPSRPAEFVIFRVTQFTSESGGK